MYLKRLLLLSGCCCIVCLQELPWRDPDSRPARRKKNGSG